MGWAEIKKAINGNLSKTLDVFIQEKTTELATHVTSNASGTNNLVKSKTDGVNNHVTSCRDQIQANIQTLLNGRVVKSVQKGIVQIPVTIPSGDVFPITINSVDTQKTAIFIISANINVVNIQLANSIRIELIRSGTQATSVSWQVIEFY